MASYGTSYLSVSCAHSDSTAGWLSVLWPAYGKWVAGKVWETYDRGMHGPWARIERTKIVCDE